MLRARQALRRPNPARLVVTNFEGVNPFGGCADDLGRGTKTKKSELVRRKSTTLFIGVDGAR
jgi:hypothetical protein